MNNQQAKSRKMNPVQEAVYNYIVERISDKRYSVGSRIPTEMALAEKLGVNRMAVHKALNHLQGHGLLFRNKRGGTTVAIMPSTFTIGELKRKTGRFVAVLNPLPPGSAHIHWNATIINSLKASLAANDLDIKEIDAKGITDIATLSETFKKLAHEGVVALLCISFDHLSRLMEESPETFFKYHRNIFMYARDIVNWSIFPYNAVSVDLFNEGVMAAEHAFDHGCDHVFFGIKDSVRECEWLKARVNGVTCGLRRLSGDAIALQEVNHDQSMEELLNAINLGRRVMLVAAADMIAVDFIETIKATTGKLPGRDYGLISFNDDSQFKKYNLTTIAPPLQEIGETLGNLIVESVADSRNQTAFIKLKSRLKPGKTS
jgi:DNA-binding LacI/PurR family transcriptional regulator